VHDVQLKTTKLKRNSDSSEFNISVLGNEDETNYILEGKFFKAPQI
jgi:hypothetical protein